MTETSAKGMVTEGKKLFKLFNPVAKNVYIKIPVNPAFREEDSTHFDGIQAIRELSKCDLLPTLKGEASICSSDNAMMCFLVFNIGYNAVEVIIADSCGKSAWTPEMTLRVA